nr:uncharacterized protein LOC127487077 [Oryctolagus cuniculus]XP_051687481.1 uncharacterized protein LOC127487077 [Oryctolagus cuniculus]
MAAWIPACAASQGHSSEETMEVGSQLLSRVCRVTGRHVVDALRGLWASTRSQPHQPFPGGNSTGRNVFPHPRPPAQPSGSAGRAPWAYRPAGSCGHCSCPLLPLPLRSPGRHRFLLSHSRSRWARPSGAPQGVCLLGPICWPLAGRSRGGTWSPPSVSPAWGAARLGPSEGAKCCSVETRGCSAAWPRGPRCPWGAQSFGVPAPGLEGLIYSQTTSRTEDCPAWLPGRSTAPWAAPPAWGLSGPAHACVWEALAEHRGPGTAEGSPLSRSSARAPQGLRSRPHQLPIRRSLLSPPPPHTPARVPEDPRPKAEGEFAGSSLEKRRRNQGEGAVRPQEAAIRAAARFLVQITLLIISSSVIE